MANIPARTAKARYAELETLRRPYLDRARAVSEVTLPYLYLPEGSTGSTDYETPYNSIGARGLNNLASKLLLALLPPGLPFFDLQVSDLEVEKLQASLAQEGGKKIDLHAEFASAMGKVTRAVSKSAETSRRSLFEALKHLWVSGNVLIQVLKDNQLRVHSLDDYVVVRDGEGQPSEILMVEHLSPATVPQRVRDAMDPVDPNEENDSADETVDVYTWIRLLDGKWSVHQEVDDNTIEGTTGTYPKDRVPFRPLRYIQASKEHYGRSGGDEYLGDLLSAEALQRSLVDLTGVAAKVVNFVDPGALFTADEFAEARSGDTLPGHAKEVSTWSLEKYGDFRVAAETAAKVERRLEQAFLLFSGVQRDAERVTAEEVIRLANELETALGGVYSLLAEELMAPLATILMAQTKDVPKLPRESVTLKVVTGVDSLGRNAELMRLETFVRGIAEVAGPEAVSMYLNLEGYFKRKAKALAIDIDGLVRTDAEVDELRQQKMMEQSLASGGLDFISQQAPQEGQAQNPTGVTE